MESKMRRVLLISLLLTGTSCSRENAQPQVKSWTLTEEQRKALGAEMQIEGAPAFIRPPAGYSRHEFSDGTLGYRWTSPRRSDGTTSSLLILIGQRPTGTIAHDLRTFPSQYLKSTSQKYGEFQVSDPELGTISGLEFVRAIWTGVDENRSRFEGHFYAAVYKQWDILCYHQDLQEHRGVSRAKAVGAIHSIRVE